MVEMRLDVEEQKLGYSFRLSDPFFLFVRQFSGTNVLLEKLPNLSILRVPRNQEEKCTIGKKFEFTPQHFSWSKERATVALKAKGTRNAFTCRRIGTGFSVTSHFIQRCKQGDHQSGCGSHLTGKGGSRPEMVESCELWDKFKGENKKERT